MCSIEKIWHSAAQTLLIVILQARQHKLNTAPLRKRGYPCQPGCCTGINAHDPAKVQDQPLQRRRLGQAARDKAVNLVDGAKEQIAFQFDHHAFFGLSQQQGLLSWISLQRALNAGQGSNLPKDRQARGVPHEQASRQQQADKNGGPRAGKPKQTRDQNNNAPFRKV